MAEYIDKKYLGRDFQIKMLAPKPQTIIETQMIIDSLPTADVVERSKLDGLDEGIRCAMCTNSMKSDSGCDGGCVVDETMYKRVIKVIREQLGD